MRFVWKSFRLFYEAVAQCGIPLRTTILLFTGSIVAPIIVELLWMKIKLISKTASLTSVNSISFFNVFILTYLWERECYSIKLTSWWSYFIHFFLQYFDSLSASVFIRHKYVNRIVIYKMTWKYYRLLALTMTSNRGLPFFSFVFFFIFTFLVFRHPKPLRVLDRTKYRN